MDILAAGNLFGYSAIVIDKGLQLSRRQRVLKQESDDIQGDKTITKDRKVTTFDLIVPNGKKHNVVVCAQVSGFR